jgi:hypothetical protein
MQSWVGVLISFAMSAHKFACYNSRITVNFHKICQHICCRLFKDLTR